MLTRDKIAAMGAGFVQCQECTGSSHAAPGEWVNLARLDEFDPDFLHRNTVWRHRREDLLVVEVDGLPGASSYEGLSITRINEVIDLLAAAAKRGYDLDALVIYAENSGERDPVVALQDALQEFEDVFYGQFDSLEDAAYDLCEGLLGDLEEFLRDNIDWTGVWEHLCLSGDFWDAYAPAGGRFIFRGC